MGERFPLNVVSKMEGEGGGDGGVISFRMQSKEKRGEMSSLKGKLT